MKRHSALMWVVLAAPITCLQGADSTGTISGSVAAANGTPIDAVLLLHDLGTARVAGSKAFDYQFSSKKNGTFSLSNVPPGTYEICVDAPHHVVLDPCRWNSSQSRITVAAGQTVSNIAVVVNQGYLLTVRVNDPASVLPTGNGGTPGAALQLTLQGSGHYENLRLASIDAGGRTQFLVIPYNVPFTLSATGTGVALSDASGNRYGSNSVQLPVFVPSATSAPGVATSTTAPGVAGGAGPAAVTLNVSAIP